MSSRKIIVVAVFQQAIKAEVSPCVSLFEFTADRRIVVFENRYRCYFAVKVHNWRPNFTNIIAELHSMEVSSDVLCPFLVWGLRPRFASLSVGLSRWNYEVQRRFFSYVHKNGTHDQMKGLSFLFLDKFQISGKSASLKSSRENPSRFETLERFWWEYLISLNLILSRQQQSPYFSFTLLLVPPLRGFDLRRNRASIASEIG